MHLDELTSIRPKSSENDKLSDDFRRSWNFRGNPIQRIVWKYLSEWFNDQTFPEYLRSSVFFWFLVFVLLFLRTHVKLFSSDLWVNSPSQSAIVIRVKPQVIVVLFVVLTLNIWSTWKQWQKQMQKDFPGINVIKSFTNFIIKSRW